MIRLTSSGVLREQHYVSALQPARRLVVRVKVLSVHLVPVSAIQMYSSCLDAGADCRCHSARKLSTSPGPSESGWVWDAETRKRLLMLRSHWTTGRGWVIWASSAAYERRLPLPYMCWQEAFITFSNSVEFGKVRRLWHGSLPASTERLRRFGCRDDIRDARAADSESRHGFFFGAVLGSLGFSLVSAFLDGLTHSDSLIFPYKASFGQLEFVHNPRPSPKSSIKIAARMQVIRHVVCVCVCVCLCFCEKVIVAGEEPRRCWQRQRVQEGLVKFPVSGSMIAEVSPVTTMSRLLRPCVVSFSPSTVRLKPRPCNQQSSPLSVSVIALTHVLRSARRTGSGQLKESEGLRDGG